MENIKELSQDEMKSIDGGVVGIIIVGAALLGIGIGIWLGLRESDE